MATIRCLHCQGVVQGDLDQEWKHKLCFCGEQISRQTFLNAVAMEDILLEPKNWDEENARSLRSIALSIHVLASCALEQPEMEEVSMLDCVKSLQGANIEMLDLS